MQSVTYTMDFPKIRRAVLAAAISGMLAAGSMVMVFEVALALVTKESRWFWISVGITWSLLVLLSLVVVHVMTRRIPFLHHLANVLSLTATVFLFSGQAFMQARSWLAKEGIESMVDVGNRAWFFETGLAAALLAIAWALIAVRISRGGALTLDRDGLVCRVYGKRWYWPWHELPGLKLRDPGGWLGRYLGRHLAIEDRQPVLLSNVWSQPLDEIAAELNAYRDRVRG